MGTHPVTVNGRQPFCMLAARTVPIGRTDARSYPIASRVDFVRVGMKVIPFFI